MKNVKKIKIRKFFGFNIQEKINMAIFGNYTKNNKM